MLTRKHHFKIVKIRFQILNDWNTRILRSRICSVWLDSPNFRLDSVKNCFSRSAFNRIGPTFVSVRSIRFEDGNIPVPWSMIPTVGVQHQKTAESAESSSFMGFLYVTNRNLNVIGIYVLTYCCEMAREAPS